MAGQANLGTPPFTKDFQSWVNISATPNDFLLNAGVYGLLLHATSWGTGVTLKKLVQDGSSPPNTYEAMGAAQTTDSYGTYYLTAGQYQLTFGTTTGLTGEIAKVGALR